MNPEIEVAGAGFTRRNSRGMLIIEPALDGNASLVENRVIYASGDLRVVPLAKDDPRHPVWRLITQVYSHNLIP